MPTPPTPDSPPRATLTAALNRIRQAWRDIEGFATCCTGPDIRPHVRIDYPDLLTAQNAYRGLIEIGAALQSVEPTPAPLTSDPLPDLTADCRELWHTLVCADSELSAIGHGRPPTSQDELLRIAHKLRAFYEKHRWLKAAPTKIELAEPDLTPTTGG